MARSHAKVLVQVWRDPEWTALTVTEQWLYVLLLTQPKLTLVGSLEVTTGRWAALADGMTRDGVEAALERLWDAGKVVVDPATDELLIRTFTQHDLDPNRLNQNLVKGLWGHWSCILSPALRRYAVLFMPDEVWAKVEPHAPADARQIRRSSQLQPGEWLRLRPGSPPRFEPPPSSHLPPDASNRGVHDRPVDNPVPFRQRVTELATKGTA